MPADLARAETNVFRRLSPARSRWPEIDEFDRRAGDLEQRQATISAQLADLHTRRANAPALDTERHARWIESGEKAPRPEPEAPQLDQEIEQLQQDHDALTVALGRILDEKARFVERHRSRLVTDADSRTREAHATVVALINDLAAAREDLAGLRAAAVWAATYPDAASARTPPHGIVAGELRQPLEQAGITGQIHFDRLIDLLRTDTDLLAGSCTPEQKRLIEGAATTTLDGTANWSETAEGVAADREEKQRALARYREFWGRDPA